ncbi:alpha/beta hydrolase family protein [Aphanothece sacrum]|uniref:alpha/beta hydrolase family protein n=1 Tax=Aphanothece sacrum TaxID=1122 RepID=UPI0034CF7C7D
MNRPQDISFILTQLGLLNQEDSPLNGKFNTEKVSIIGHSFGGYTALALAGATLDLKNLRRFCDENLPLGRSPADWLQCAAAELPYSERKFKDQRIKQVIAINPIIGQLFGNNLSQVKIPTLILSSSDDGITPIISHQLQPFKQLSGDKYLIVALGATHMSVTDISNSDSAMGQNTLVREIMGVQAEPVRHLMKGVSLGFIQQLTSNASQYQPFLNSTYVESLSENKIKFRLTTQLPVSLDVWLNVLSLGTPQITARPQPLEGFSLSRIKQYFIEAKYLLIKPQYSTHKLDALFTGLLDSYFHPFDDWS